MIYKVVLIYKCFGSEQFCIFAEELCNVGKVLDEKSDLLVYSRKIGKQQIGSLTQEDRDLPTLRTKFTFDALSDICIHHEKKYISRYQATQNIV